jgi:hypothetical protein
MHNVIAMLTCVHAQRLDCPSGKISLEEQDNQFWIIEDIGNNAPKDMPPRKVYFARQVCNSTVARRCNSQPHLISSLSLSL